MENSIAYKQLLKQINAVGSEKLNGYYPNTLEEIYDWERNKVEDIIWSAFCEKKEYNLAIFFPKLKNYDGLEKLKETLQKCQIPSESSVIIAKVLYESTNDDYYVEVIKRNIQKDPDNGVYVAMMSYAKPSKSLYNLLVEVYISSDNEIIRGSAVRGILYHKDFITNPYDLKKIIGMVNLRKIFDKSDRNERKKVINNLEQDMYEEYKKE